MATEEEFREGWEKLHTESGGYFDLRIFRPTDFVALIAQIAEERCGHTDMQFQNSVCSLVGQWEKGTRAPCMGCGKFTDEMGAVVAIVPTTAKATIALGAVLCGDCAHLTGEEMKARVIGFLRKMMPDVNVRELH